MKNRELRQRIAVLGALALTGAATMLAGCEKAEGTSSTTESTGVSTEAVSSTEETTSVTETVTTEAATKAQTIGNEAYNDIKLDEYSVESFETLIKNTITYSHNQISQFLSEDNPDKAYYSIISGTVSLFDDLYNSKIDINLDDECDFNNGYYDSTIDLKNYSYRDMAGIVGYYLFDSAIFNNYNTNSIDYHDYMENFVINNFINADVDGLTDFEILEDISKGRAFQDTDNSDMYNITYVRFNYNGTGYYAFVGNIDSGYRVFDIVNLSQSEYLSSIYESENSKLSNNEIVETSSENITEAVTETETIAPAPTVTETATEAQNEPTTSIYGYYELDLSARPNDEKPGMYEYDGAWYYTDGSSYYIWAQRYGIDENGNDAPSDNGHWNDIGPYSPEYNATHPVETSGVTNPHSY